MSIFFLQVIVEVRDSLRGLGTGIKRSLDDGDGKSYIRAKTRERYGQAIHVISGPQRFVAAKTIQTETKSPVDSVQDEETSPKEESNANNTPTQSKEEETIDIFAE